MERITQKDLEYLVKEINEVTNSPIRPWGTLAKPYPANGVNIGNYHLDYAYGGVQLIRMVNKAGGVTIISRRCHVPKRELYYWMQAFLAGHSAK